jgi:alpha-galactosidase
LGGELISRKEQGAVVRSTKIVFIGAASASFGPACLLDAIHCEGLAGSTLVLVDIDAERLEVMARLARRLNEVSGAGLIIEHTTDRCEALPGAEFVINSIAIDRNELWKLDWSIPLKHGIKQVLGENGGPGGLSHSLRNIPAILAICKDMERLCPEALFINFSNPESRVCLAIRQAHLHSVGGAVPRRVYGHRVHQPHHRRERLRRGRGGHQPLHLVPVHYQGRR